MSFYSVQGTASHPIGSQQSAPQPQHERRGREAEEGEVVPQRFRLLNELELRGVRADCERLQKRFTRDRDPETHVALLKSRLLELGHCYQGKKDELIAKDARLQQAKAEMREKDRRIDALGKERDEAIRKKRKRDEEYEGVQKQEREKTQKLDAATTKLKAAQAKQKEMEEIQSELQKAFAAKCSQIEGLQQKLTAEAEQRRQAQEKLAASASLLQTKDSELAALKEAHAAGEKQNEGLQKKALAFQQTLLATKEQIASILEQHQ